MSAAEQQTEIEALKTRVADLEKQFEKLSGYIVNENKIKDLAIKAIREARQQGRRI